MKHCIAFCAVLCAAFAAFCAPKAGTPDKSGVNYDLTRYSATMVYSTVFDMMMSPERYQGKKVRIRGTFEVFPYGDGENASKSYACVIKDATACCAQGMEFVLAGEKTYPADYPAVGAECTVTGRFLKEDIDGLTYIRLVDAVLE